MSNDITTYTDDDYHIEFRGYDYDLHQAYDESQGGRGMALIEASMCRQFGTTDMSHGQICRACVKQLSNGRWGVYIRFVTVGY